MTNVDIVQFDKDFNFIQNISTNEIFIKDKVWKLKNALINTELVSNQKVDAY